MNINPKTFKSFDGYTIDESEFIQQTGFIEIKSFLFPQRDDEYTVAIGKIGNEIYWYKSNYWGRIWVDDGFGKIS